jgi:hypothetical protein
MNLFLETVARIAFAMALLCNLGSAQQAPPNACEMVKNILAEASDLKPGRSRADLEKAFTVSSFSTRNAATYTSKNCHYIAIDIEFHPADSPEGPPLPTDKIVKVSRPYLALPNMD